MVLKTIHLTGNHHKTCFKHSNFLNRKLCVSNRYPHGTPWQQQGDREPKEKQKTPQRVETRFKKRQLQHAPSPVWAWSASNSSNLQISLHPWDLPHSREASNLGARANKVIAALNRIAMGGTHVNTRCAKAIKWIENTSRREGNNNMDQQTLFTSSLRVVEVVKELGLITCGRSVFCQGARLLGWRRRRGYLTWRCPHGRRGSGLSTGRSGRRRARGRRDTRRESERRSNEEQTLNRSSWMARIRGDARTQTLQPCNVIAHQLRSVNCTRNMTCEVYLSTPPVGYSGFAIDCKRNQL